MAERSLTADAGFEPLFDATFRGRLLRQSLSSQEMADLVLAVEALNETKWRYECFLRWLTSMDDPDDVAGLEERRTVTLEKIIGRAEKAVTGG